MRLFIFGAGTTIGTLDVPGVKGFGAQLAKEMPYWRSMLGSLREVVDALEPRNRRSADDWDLDAAWTHVDYFAKLNLALDTRAFSGSASAGLHAAVSRVYGTLDIDRVRRAYDAKRQFTLREELDRVVAGDVVVSFNWDTLVESLLCHRFATTSLRLVQVPHPPLNESVRFAKPHGSLTWNRYDPSVIDDGHAGPKLSPIPNWASIVASENLAAVGKFEPLLLGAVPIKSELIKEVAPQQHQLIMEQWATLCRAISDADELCIVGYGFPTEDSYGRFLMRQAARRRQRRISRVDLYEVATKVESVRNAIVEVFDVSPADIADRGSVSFKVEDQPDVRG
jgi:hypothetical protein